MHVTLLASHPLPLRVLRCQSSLRPTWIAQPAILTHSVAVWRILSHELGYTSAADACSAVMGHSLGEFSALCVAGTLSFADTVQLVVSRHIEAAGSIQHVRFPY